MLVCRRVSLGTLLAIDPEDRLSTRPSRKRRPEPIFGNNELEPSGNYQCNVRIARHPLNDEPGQPLTASLTVSFD